MKQIFYTLILFPLSLFAQPPSNWHHLDPQTDSVLGISSLKAYELLQGITPDTVIVALIDNGAQLSHEDLQGVFWTNPGEIAGNGLDDDGNGYIDDIHGWNFLGNEEGRNLKRETTGLTRVYAHLDAKYNGLNMRQLAEADWQEFEYYLHIREEYNLEFKKKMTEISIYTELLNNFRKADKSIREHLGKEEYSDTEVKQLDTTKAELRFAQEYLAYLDKYELNEQKIESIISNLKSDLLTRLNPEHDARALLVGDDPDNMLDTVYGNNRVDARGPAHGTGIAGIIGALNNGMGVDGIAQHVQLMILRIVPNGDEREKDVALAIRYAVRNGADIINMSFAKKYGMHPEFVQEAITEAERAGVLIVHAAGNSGSNNDSIPYYPTG